MDLVLVLHEVVFEWNPNLRINSRISYKIPSTFTAGAAPFDSGCVTFTVHLDGVGAAIFDAGATLVALAEGRIVVILGVPVGA
jgi:hypothetical protein